MYQVSKCCTQWCITSLYKPQQVEKRHISYKYCRTSLLGSLGFSCEYFYCMYNKIITFIISEAYSSWMYGSGQDEYGPTLCTHSGLAKSFIVRPWLAVIYI